MSLVEMCYCMSKRQTELQAQVCAAGLTKFARDGDLPSVHAQYTHALTKHLLWS